MTVGRDDRSASGSGSRLDGDTGPFGYRVLDGESLGRLHRAGLSVLERTGVEVRDERALADSWHARARARRGLEGAYPRRAGRAGGRVRTPQLRVAGAGRRRVARPRRSARERALVQRHRLPVLPRSGERRAAPGRARRRRDDGGRLRSAARDRLRHVGAARGTRRSSRSSLPSSRRCSRARASRLSSRRPRPARPCRGCSRWPGSPAAATASRCWR